jgi:dUTP pyrophosphatase
MDLFAVEKTTIEPGTIVAVPTGVAIEIPQGYVSLVWDKSSIPLKYSLTTMGGVIDHTYRGEYKIIMFNAGKESHTFERGDKIAQLLIQPVISGEVVEVKDLSNTVRGDGGFGSTGKN